MSLHRQLPEDTSLVDHSLLLSKLGEGPACCLGGLRARPPSLNRAFYCVAQLGLEEELGGQALTLQPFSYPSPLIVTLELLVFAHDAFGARHVLLLNNSPLLHVFLLHFQDSIVGHLDVLKRQLILSLAPLREGCRTIPLPEQLLDRAQAFVLPPGQLLVTGELTDILEASLPDRLLDHTNDARREVLAALCMGRPRVEDMSKSALKVAVLVVFHH